VLDEDYLQLPAPVGIARAVNDRDLSAAEVAEAALRRIEQVDGTVRAFSQVLVSSGLVEEAEVSLGDPEPVWTALRPGRST
jgi:Asp-tRNA(Asn)/Glu-tRNA(Gln) amidotransferase A subunit family amidase